MPYTPPRRVLSAVTTVSVVSTNQAPAWVQTIDYGEFADIPETPTISASAGSAYNQIITGHVDSDSGYTWNDHYGPGGGMLFTGGGHTHAEYPYAWVFDGLKVEDNLPGWRPLNLAPPGTVPGLPLLINGYAPYKYDEGSEYSTVQANMPAGAIAVGYKPWYFMYSLVGKYGTPFSNYMEYGECATNTPAGFHAYNHIFPLAPGELGVGAKGGWANVFKAGVTAGSGMTAPWGHIIDADTGIWKRQQYRWPPETGFHTAGTSAGYGKACAFDGFAYTMFGDTDTIGLVRTNLTDGTHLNIRLAQKVYFQVGGWEGVPGTTILFFFKVTGPAGYSFGTRAEFKPMILDVNPALPYTSRIPTFINIDPATPNPLAAPEYHGNLDPTFAHATAQMWWIPEVGAFAAFGAQKLDNVINLHGDWPFGIVWYFPPNPPEQGTASWFTGLWTCELEPLTAVDTHGTKALLQNNRGAGPVRASDSSAVIGPLQLQYRATFFSQKLRCFIHMPHIGNGNIFFFRSRKIP